MSFCHILDKNTIIFVFMDKNIHYTLSGKGKAVVLLHGFLESSTMWSKLVPFLAKKNKVICIDFPGFGKSSCLTEIHSMELLAKVIKDVLDEAKIKKATLIGHSMGGYVALAFAELFPDKLQSIILLNSGTLSDSPERKKQREQAIYLATLNKEKYVSMAINNLFLPSSGKLFSSEISQLKTEAKLFPLCGITAALNGMKVRKDRTEIAKHLTVPKFFIAGKQDPLIPFSVASNLAKITNMKLITLTGGHMGMIENYNEIVKKLHLINIL